MRSTRCRRSRPSSCTPATSRTFRRPQQFDDARAILSQLKAPLIALPGEHDVIGERRRKRTSNFKHSRFDAGRLGVVGRQRRPLRRRCSTSSTSRRWACWAASSSIGSPRISTAVAAIDAGRRLYARSALRALSGVGLDDRGRQQGAGAAAAIRPRHGAQRAHPSDRHAPGGQYPVCQRRRDGIPAAKTGCRAETRSGDASSQRAAPRHRLPDRRN